MNVFLATANCFLSFQICLLLFFIFVLDQYIYPFIMGPTKSQIRFRAHRDAKAVKLNNEDAQLLQGYQHKQQLERNLGVEPEGNPLLLEEPTIIPEDD